MLCPQAICLQKQEAEDPIGEAKSATFNAIAMNEHPSRSAPCARHGEEGFPSQMFTPLDEYQERDSRPRRTGQTAPPRRQKTDAHGSQKPGRAIGEHGVPTANVDPIQWVFHQTREHPLENVKVSGTGAAMKSEKPGRAEGRQQNGACGVLADILEKNGRWKWEA